MSDPVVKLCAGRFLGKGSTKTVHEGEWQGRKVAMLRGCDARETELLRELRGYLYIVEFVAVVDGIVLTELAPRGSLRDVQDELDFEQKKIPATHVGRIHCQLLSGLRAVWSRGYVHGDVRPPNVLVFGYDESEVEATHVKLCDFGEARRSTEVQRDKQELCALIVDIS